MTGISLGIIVFIFALAPLLVTPDIKSRKNMTNDETGKGINSNFHEGESKHVNRIQGSAYELKNEMTLIEVSEKYDVPLAELSSELGIPIDKSSETIGCLKREFRFSLSSLRETIINNQ